MSGPVRVSVHASQFPEKVMADLAHSLSSRQINHKFHYDSYKQTQKWLELHQAYAPSRTDPDCEAAYDAAFHRAAHDAGTGSVHLIGLGCGGGQKDTRLLRALKGTASLVYLPVDVSVAMVLVAHQAASQTLSEIRPLVCDLACADDLASVVDGQLPAAGRRIITFFGMMPNFEPEFVLPKLAALLRKDDLLLVSANLAPGKDYASGVRRVLPQYHNALTTDWLLTFLLDLGVEKTDGVMEWKIEPCPSGRDLLRLTAWFRFCRDRLVRVAGKEFRFAPNEAVRLFFSYRYTPERLRRELAKHGLAVKQQWITRSGEEGVFLCRR